MSSKRKTGLFLITLAAMLGLMLAMAGAAYAEDAVEYQEASWDQKTKQVVYTTKSVSSYTKVTSDMGTRNWKDWYVVDSDVTIEDDYIFCTGTVNLILCDECTLTVSKGIDTEGRPLNIYSQSAGTGELIAAGSVNAAGIGGRSAEAVGNITIHGGTVTATGGDNGAGIGGGQRGAGGEVTIYGGTVTATGGNGAGIGGGREGAGGKVSIYGGMVAATGGYHSAGIGGGENGAGGEVTIHGGTITATGVYGGAGIGGGENGAGKTVTIYGGTVTATGEDHGAGIGGGSHGVGGSVAIHGGLVIAAGYGAVGIGGGGRDASHGSLTVAPSLIVYGDNEDPYPTTVIDKKDGDYIRWVNMKVDYPHKFTYSANGATITAVCSETACSLPDRKTELTITAPERTVYGDTDKSAEASLTGLPMFRSATMKRIETSDIKYYKATVADNIYTKEGEALPEAPADAGTYVAEQTVDDTTNHATASIGYTIAKAGASCTPPTAKEELVYNGSAQELVDAGTAEGGTMSYALGSNKTNAPASGWSESIPKGKAIQTYYVWYKVAGDANHEDIEPSCIEVKIDREDLDRVRPDSWSGNGTEETPYVISTKEDWNALAELVGDGYTMEGVFFALGEDIVVTDMAGTYEKPFSGSFDGDGHTLTFNADEAPEICAPFVYVNGASNGASFKNLHIAGTIKTKQQFAAGLIGHFDGKVNVTNCRCSITIDSSVNGDGTHGGFIVAGERNGAACFEGCVFDGKLLGAETTKCGGFVGWANPTDKIYTVKDCLFAPQELTLKSEVFNFIRNAPGSKIIQNSYYTENIDDNSQGKAGRSVTADDGITVGAGNATEYKVSGITAYDTGLAYEETFNERVYYAGKDEVIPVSIPSVCDGITASAGTLTGEDTTFTLTMPDEDVTLTLNKGVNHKWKEATCTEPKTCSVCSTKEGKALGHDWGEASYTWSADNSEVKAEHTCTRCKTTEDETVAVTSEVTKPPTCVDKGETTYTPGEFNNKAFKAQAKTLEDVPATGHDWGDWTPLDENQHQKVCGNDPAHVETKDHVWDEGVVTKEPTTEETGVKTFTCSICKAERTEIIPIKEEVDPITPSDDTADDTPVDDDIPVVNTAKIHTKGNFTKKQMKLIFPADKSVTNYRIQYRMAGKKSWKSDWSAGTNMYVIGGVKKSSLCEFRIAGYEKLTDGSWVRGNWSKISYRYMSAVPLKTIKADKKKITVTWKKDRKASGYEVRCSLKKNMTKAKTIYVKGGSKTKLTIKKLKSGKKYYVQIRPAKVKSGKRYVGILTNVKAARVK